MCDNDIWDLAQLPKGVKFIGCKWIRKIKRNFNGNIKRYKVCLVTKRFTQWGDIACKENFSLVSLKDSFITIMSLVAHFELDLHQNNVKTAFVNEFIK